ncbi:MAG: EamA family transporter [Sphingobium sp.]|nr:MAG: EamA family transporter [Sphingobium sp.]
MAGEGRPEPSARLTDSNVIVPFCVVTLIWGSTWLVIRDQLGVVPAGWSITYRFAIAAAAMFALALARGVPLRLGWRGMAFAACIGLLQFTFNFNLVYRAEMRLTSGLVAVFYALLPVPNCLLAYLAFRQRATPGYLAGMAIAVCGVGLLFLHEYRMAGSAAGAQVAQGLVLCLTALMCASIANVMQGTQLAHRLPMMAVLAWAMLFGTLVDAAWTWSVAGPPVIDTRPGYVAGVLYLALAGSVVTFPLYYRLIQRIGPSRAAYTSVLIPVIAMLLSTVFEGYDWSLLAAGGALLSLIGMVFAMREKQSASPSR